VALREREVRTSLDAVWLAVAVTLLWRKVGRDPQISLLDEGVDGLARLGGIGMRLRWDWFRSVAAVPYVPTLGAVHPRALTAQLLDDVLDTSGTGRFLPHDKDQRWATSKDEMVLAEGINHTPRRTIIPTLARRGRGVIKIHCYGTAAPDLPDLAKAAGQLCAEHGAAAARVVWFCPPGAPPTTAGAGDVRVLLKTFGAAGGAANGAAYQLLQTEIGGASERLCLAEGLETLGFVFSRLA
jgi:hypothetical protein